MSVFGGIWVVMGGNIGMVGIHYGVSGSWEELADSLSPWVAYRLCSQSSCEPRIHASLIRSVVKQEFR